MFSITKALFAVLAMTMTSQAAFALRPQEVVVVSNANVPESVSLGKHYAAVRGIPAENILLVNTTADYLVSRADYEAQIRRPLRQFLISNRLVNKVRCICLMWGVPVRVGAAAPKGQAGKLMALYRTAATKVQYRLAIDYKLLGTVVRKFPTPTTDGLAPVGKLFESPIPAPSPPLPSQGQLRKDIDKLFEIKQAEVARLRDPAQRRIASRQLMGLQLDIYGLEGLIRHINKAKPPNPPDILKLTRRRDEAKKKLEKLLKASQTPQNIRAAMDAMELISGVISAGSHAHKWVRRLGQSDASVDSELALMWWSNYELIGQQRNPLNWRVPARTASSKIPPTMMTARIDGPTAVEARRIIDDSVATEKVGLKGTFYIDAGGKLPKYDLHLRKLRDFLLAKSRIKVVIDEERTTFAEGTCPQAALYVGWYSLAKYVPAFTWNRGATGWHIASFEARHLRDPQSNEWCVKMLQNGVAATIGAVEEPYLTSFPIPEEFFPLLLTGKYTLAECYWRTVPSVSWRLTLIGDPLYTPFAANPQVSIDALPKGLAPETNRGPQTAARPQVAPSHPATRTTASPSPADRAR